MPFDISSASEEFQKQLHEITPRLAGVKVTADYTAYSFMVLAILTNAPTIIET